MKYKLTFILAVATIISLLFAVASYRNTVGASIGPEWFGFALPGLLFLLTLLSFKLKK